MPLEFLDGLLDRGAIDDGCCHWKAFGQGLFGDSKVSKACASARSRAASSSPRSEPYIGSRATRDTSRSGVPAALLARTAVSSNRSAPCRSPIAHVTSRTRPIFDSRVPWCHRDGDRCRVQQVVDHGSEGVTAGQAATRSTHHDGFGLEPHGLLDQPVGERVVEPQLTCATTSSGTDASASESHFSPCSARTSS